ncbi:MAG: hypothetical protein Q8938_21200, partial [Bacteroidota bacterium]|nr:hypothetical protein [Bacteroidota bacterium]
MKKFPYIAVLFFLAWIVPGKTSAQARADWMPDEGFWQVVACPTDKQPNDKQTLLVQFYGFHEQLIYEEQLDVRDFNPHKRRTRLVLNECLRTALSAST